MSSSEHSIEVSSIRCTKRKQSKSQACDLERTIKRRAGRACQSCRTRKVRCDVLVNGVRCTNCKLDNIECALLASRRGKSDKGSKESRDWPTESPPSSNRDVNVVPPVPVDEECDERAYLSPESTAANTDDVPVCLTFDDEEARDSTEPNTGQDNRFEVPEVQQSVTATSEARSASAICFTNSPPLDLHLPSFIKPLPKHMDSDDVEFLRRKGAFIVPEAGLRLEILRNYIFSVYPFMPILDLREFLDGVFNEHDGGGVSLLLYQAVMFAGLASLKGNVIQETGSRTLKQARKIFFTKVRLLYDFDIEPNNTTVLQSLLLMSLAYEKWNDQKHTWHWTGQALSLAQYMGLHRGTNGSDIPQKVQRLRRRLWWGLYNRDRLIGLGTRRPVRIKDDEYDVPMLTLHDFDTEPFNAPFAMHPDGISIGQDESQNKLLALMCIELTKLCICIGRVLASQYTTLGERTQLTRTMMVAPKPSVERAQGLSICSKELEEWYQNLHPHVQTIARQSARGALSNCQEIQWSILHMIHQTSVIVLHRPQVLQPCLSGADAAEVQKASRAKVKEAARKLTQITHTMLRRDKVRFLPTSGVPALLSASLGHMLDIKSKDEDVRDASIFRFYQTMQILQRLREVYASADSAVSFLALAVRKAGISVSIQLAAQQPSAFMMTSTGTQPVDPTILHQTRPPSDGLAMQVARSANTNMQLRESQADPYAEFMNGLKRAELDEPQTSDQQPGSLHGATILQTTAGLNQVNTSAGEASTYETNAVSNRGLTEVDYGRSLDGYDATLQDPLSFWVADEAFSNVNSSLDHDMSEEPIELHYDFCSDAFGLLDALGMDSDDNDTIVVNRLDTG